MSKLFNHTLVVRALSGAAFVAVVAAAIFCGPWTFGALLTVVCAGCLWEFYRLSAAIGAEPQRWAGVVAGVFTVAGGVCANEAFGLSMILWIAAFLMLWGFFAAELYRKRERPLINIASTIAGLLYVAVPLLILFFIANRKDDFDDALYRPWEMMTYFLVVWASDTGAYLTGVSFGRHRLFERISPKKSWEGFFGGLVFAAAVGALMGHAMGGDMIVWGGLGLLVAVTGVFGDLVESMFKRSADMKDSGNILPGHGGFLDRFDSLIFSAPFVFIYFVIFTP